MLQGFFHWLRIRVKESVLGGIEDAVGEAAADGWEPSNLPKLTDNTSNGTSNRSGRKRQATKKS